MKSELHLTFNCRIIAKARPRYSNGRCYLPKKYRIWQGYFRALIIDQLPEYYDPINKAAIEIVFQGSLEGDLDNLAGSVLDCLVQTQVIKDDSIKNISKLSLSYIDKKPKGCSIKITEL